MVRVFAARGVGDSHISGLRLLEQGFFSCFPQETSLPIIERTETGKPFFPTRPEIHFNLSHSGEWVVCALSDRPVGIDLQQERPLRANVSRKFSLAEQEFLQEQTEHAFFDLWAKKEAFLKATGQGLTVRLDQVPVLPLPVCHFNDYVNQILHFPDPGYHLAVCCQSAEGNVPGLFVETVNFS